MMRCKNFDFEGFKKDFSCLYKGSYYARRQITILVVCMRDPVMPDGKLLYKGSMQLGSRHLGPRDFKLQP